MIYEGSSDINKYYRKEINNKYTSLLSTKWLVLLLGAVTNANSQPEESVPSKSPVVEGFVSSPGNLKNYYSCFQWFHGFNNNIMINLWDLEKYSCTRYRNTAAFSPVLMKNILTVKKWIFNLKTRKWKGKLGYPVKWWLEPMHCFPQVPQQQDLFHSNPA